MLTIPPVRPEEPLSAVEAASRRTVDRDEASPGSASPHHERLDGRPSPPSTYTGTHLLADLNGCRGLDDAVRVEQALREAVAAADATLIDVRVHHFGPGHGVTGVALLAESHISIHTWPEHGYAAVDIFLCGTRHDLDAALAALTKRLEAGACDERRIARGYGLP